jgi:hypothetical protein
MFEPMLEPYKTEFQRLHRIQKRLVFAAPVAIVGLVFPMLLLGYLDSTEWVVLPALFIGMAWMAVLEVKKTLLYRRDLMDRE